MSLRWDGHGIQLADVPGSGTSRIAAGQKSGNKAHDTRSGKFGQTGGGPQPPARAKAPAQSDPAEYARMIDAVREAARSLPNFDEGTITDFIKSRANSPDAVDINAFIQQVEEQRKADLVDLLDQSLRTGKTKIRLTASRGYVKELMAQAKSDTIAEVMTRLEAKGHDRDKVEAFFKGKVSTHEEAVKKRDAIAAAGLGWSGDFFDAITTEEPDEDSAETHQKIHAEFASLLERMPAPVINVEVKMPEGGGRKTVKRNETTGLIEAIEEE
jgi:hypothetical protein